MKIVEHTSASLYNIVVKEVTTLVILFRTLQVQCELLTIETTNTFILLQCLVKKRRMNIQLNCYVFVGFFQ